ncbi:MAG: hypothetical protein KDJ36_07915 [Hyphomicrobiaceae bacterium]|nr:hypothetical protein [Hyphomicrobiaceae bacterium]
MDGAGSNVSGDAGLVTADEADNAPTLPAEYAWLEGSQPFVACAFYTPNYLPQVLSLKASLEKFGINHYLKQYERGATWEATTRLKPVFVNHCIDKFPDRHVLYLDADAVVRRPMTLIEEIETDIAIAFHPLKAGGRNYLRISAGALFVRNNEKGRRFARAWMDAEKDCGPLTLDEDMIYMSFDTLQGASITVLPATYYKIFDRPGADPVLEHFQASRKQFKWRRLIRRARRVAVGVGVVAAALLVWWLSRHIAWVP